MKSKQSILMESSQIDPQDCLQGRLSEVGASLGGCEMRAARFWMCVSISGGDVQVQLAGNSHPPMRSKASGLRPRSP